MDTFSDIHEDFEEKVQKRKEQLVEKMLSSPSAKDTFFSITDNTKHLEDFLEEVYALSRSENDSSIVYRLDDMDEDDYRIRFRNIKKNIHYSAELSRIPLL